MPDIKPSKVTHCVEPSGPPSDVKIDAISSTSISMSWKPPAILDWNGIITTYKATLFLSNGTSQEYYFEFNGYRTNYVIQSECIWSEGLIIITALIV